jgi:hypothetical protein
MTNTRFPTITREKLLAAVSALPAGAEISFSGLEFIEFEPTQKTPGAYRARALFRPNVYRTAAGEVVVDNPE